MPPDDDESLELKLARQARDEAAADRKAAAADLESARDEHARAARCLADTAELERNIAAREQKLKELGEPDFVAREQAVEQKLAEAKALLATYSNDRHAAAIALTQINERELAARQKVA
jgi:hypothetical protein